MIKNKRSNSRSHWLKLAALSGGLMLGATGAGQAGETTIEINANIESGCKIDPEINGLVSKTIIPIEPDGSIGGPSLNIDLGTMSCNSRHTIKLKTLNGGLKRSVPASIALPGFTDLIPYTASVPWANLVLTANGTADASAFEDVEEPKSGGFFIVVSTIKDDGTYVLAGEYKDILTLTITSSL